MHIDQLDYKNLINVLAKYNAKGRGESAGFLSWFLENIYRLDETTADDAMCDEKLDKGIDGIYVDDNAEEIHFFQAKLSQKQKTIGDSELKKFVGSLGQFRDPNSIQKILEGNAAAELKRIINRKGLIGLVEKGYKVVGIFVTNSLKDQNTEEYLKIDDSIRVYCAEEIVNNFIEFDADEGVPGTFVFDTSYAGVIELTVDSNTTVYLLPASAAKLVAMEGIADGTLFSQNVRLSLGNTPVNKAIAQSISDKAEHKHFPLYHNGITVICQNAELDGTAETLTIRDFVVVNGAQSLSTFFHHSSKMSSDLRVFVKVISLSDRDLARRITINSNNQNAIKPRDLRANHDLMLRLKEEFRTRAQGYDIDIKRGQEKRKASQL